MATIQDYGARWAKLHEEWHIAQQDYLLAALSERQAFEACAAGQGAGPSQRLVEEVDVLRRAADAKRAAMDDFLRAVFKG